MKVQIFRLSDGYEYRTGWTVDSSGVIRVQFIYKSMVYLMDKDRFNLKKELLEHIKKAI